ncbi:MAG: galactose-1-phosphate uridylyltransferase [Deltaproteobacteria bacterium]|nr:galactose-1-phosphate uridylyltransferase [Deltaproteobacteria bacterium]
MSEIRRNPVTGEWVVMAPERARRPQPAGPAAVPAARPRRSADCPFCPGNEAQTEPTAYREPDGEWEVRSFANRFSLLAAAGEPWLREEGLRATAAAVGPHEVVCESRRHDLSLARLEPPAVARVVRAWHARFAAFHADPRVAFVSLFKNQGLEAGASQEHAHSQVVGLPLVPAVFAERQARARHHHAATGGCLLCRILEEEMRDGGRLVHATEHFVTFVPWAALSPYHLWLFPRRHAGSFAAALPEELVDLGAHLRAVLGGIAGALGDPAFNLVVQSDGPGVAGDPALHWYLSVVPRVGRAAGFELGTAMYVNPSRPEDCAALLRAAC